MRTVIQIQVNWRLAAEGAAILLSSMQTVAAGPRWPWKSPEFAPRPIDARVAAA